MLLLSASLTSFLNPISITTLLLLQLLAATTYSYKKNMENSTFKSRFTYNFPKPTAFLSYYISPRYAISVTKYAKGLYNIKAPNFRQDIGYLYFIKDYSDIKDKFDFLR